MDYTIIHFSSWYYRTNCDGHLETVKHLVSQGADIRAVDDSAVRWSFRDSKVFSL
jgi:hypothetical protein